jgi:hypothetical protein
VAGGIDETARQLTDLLLNASVQIAMPGVKKIDSDKSRTRVASVREHMNSCDQTDPIFSEKSQGLGLHPIWTSTTEDDTLYAPYVRWPLGNEELARHETELPSSGLLRTTDQPVSDKMARADSWLIPGISVSRSIDSSSEVGVRLDIFVFVPALLLSPQALPLDRDSFPHVCADG